MRSPRVHKAVEGSSVFPVSSSLSSLLFALCSFLLAISPPPAFAQVPTIDNAGASGITTNSATLNGYLVDFGSPATSANVRVYWGLSDGGGTFTNWSNVQNFGWLYATGAISTNISGLLPGSNYYYRFFASNELTLTSWASSTTNFVTQASGGGGSSYPTALDGFDPGADGRVRCFAIQPDGKILVGGNFTTLAGQPHNYIGRLYHDGSLDNTFTNGANGEVLSLVIQSDGKILVGGGFSTLAGQARGDIARLNADGSLDNTFTNGANSWVRSLDIQPDGRILVVGDFTTLAGQPRNYIGRLNSDGSLDNTFTNGAGARIDSVMLQDDGKILVGGLFATLAGQARNYIGRLNADGSLDNTFTNGANNLGYVHSIAIQSDCRILVGGQFIALAGQARNYIGRLNADGSLDTTFTNGANNEIDSIAVQPDGKILVGGLFSTLAGQARNYIGRLNADGSLDTTFTNGANNAIDSIAVQPDGNILFGGSFTNLAGQARNYIGRLYPDGSLDATLTSGADSTVYSLAVQSDDKILVGGLFTTLAGQARNYIGRLNADGSLDNTFTDDADGEVNSIAVQPDGKIVVGGYFTTLAGQARSRLGRLNADGSLDNTFTNDADSAVLSTIVQADGKILVGGQFTTLAGQARNYIGRLNADGSLDNTFTNDADSAVLSIALQPDGKIVVGGYFTTLAGQARNYIGRFNADGSLDSTFTNGASYYVNSIAVQPDGKIVVSGLFTTLAGQARSRIGRFNADGSLDSTFTNGADTNVNSIAVQPDGKIVVSGLFTTLAGQARSYIGRLNADGSLDNTFTNGANNYVHSIAVQPDGKILLGGTFTTLAGQARNYMGRLAMPDAAIQLLTVDASGTSAAWQRAGAGPEVWRTTLETSTNGTDWSTNLVAGTRTTNGWAFTNLSLPFNEAGWVRARGYAAGGSCDASHSIIESARMFYLNVLPTVNNGTGATGITTNSATLNGNLTSTGGAPTTVTIYWGEVDGNTNAGTWSNSVFLGTLPASPFATNIIGLTTNTTYYYRSFASNAFGTAWAPNTTNFTTGDGSIQPDGYDVLFLKANGVGSNFVDSSIANPKTITANGNARQLPIKLNRSAGFFNGTTDYVKVPDSADWDIGTGDYTFETFIFITSKAAVTRQFVVDIGSYANNKGIAVFYHSGGDYLIVWHNGSGGGDEGYFPWVGAVNTWYHLMVTRTSGVVKCYIDGVQIGSNWNTARSAAAIDASTYGITIGFENEHVDYGWYGWMKELRFSTVARAATVPGAEYTADANTKLLMHFDTPASSPIGPAISIPSTSGDYLTVPDSADWDLGDLTLECWFKMNANVGNKDLIDLNPYSSGALLTYYGNTTSFTYDAFIDNTRVNQAISPTPPANTWHHYALVRSGSTAYCFWNGRLLNVGGTSVGSNVLNVSSVFIGDNTFDGFMKEVRVSKTARYVSSFTPSQTPFVSDSNTLLLLHGDENNGVTTFTDSSPYARTVTTSGNCITKYTEDYRSSIFKDDGNTGHNPYPQGSAKVDFFAAFGNASYYGVGTGVGTDYLRVPDSADFDFGSGDFTIELYFRHQNPAYFYGYFLSALDGPGTSGYIGHLYDGTEMRFYQDASGAMHQFQNISPNISWYTWHHVAYVRSGSNFNCYLNGSQAGTTKTVAGNFDAAGDLELMSSTVSAQYWNGRTDNIRISKGIARYSATFNPPEDVGPEEAVPPTISNAGGATAITTNSATLNGNLVSTGGAPTTVYVFWGTNDGGAAWGAWGNTNNLGINAAGPLSIGQTGLISQTTYFYRFYASNSAGFAWAPSTTNFTTDGDGDADGMLDSWEITYFGNTTTANASTDNDGDGLRDVLEFQNGTDPTVQDSDSDTFSDYIEVINNTSPTNNLSKPSYPYKEWTSLWGSGMNDNSNNNQGVTVDNSGNVYVAGASYGTFDGQTNSGGNDLCLTKYSPAGLRLWSRLWGSSSDDVGFDVVVDATGGVYVAGHTAGAFDGQTNTGGAWDLCLSKFDSNGTRLWSRIWGSGSTDQSYGMNIDSSNNVYVSGVTQGAFDGQTNAGAYNAFLTKFTPDGTRAWSRICGGAFDTRGFDPAVDASNNVYMSGYTSDPFDGQTNSGNYDACVIKFASDGTKLWTRLWGGTTQDCAFAASVYGANVYLAGLSQSSFDGQTNIADRDLLLTKYSLDGTRIWSRIWGSAGVDEGAAVAADSQGNVFVVAYSDGSFDGQTNNGGDDLTLTRWLPDGTKVWTRIWGSAVYEASRAISVNASNNAIYVAGVTSGSFDGQTNSGLNDFCLTKWIDAPSLEIQNLPATGITTNSATLNGNLVSTGGAPTTVTIYWGEVDGNTNAAAWSNSVFVGVLPAGPFSIGQTGLTSQTTYFYRCFASNISGVAWAPSTTNFTTPSNNLGVGLMAYYPFSGNANDESGNGNNGTVNGAILSTNRFGSANTTYYFDGSDHIATPFTPVFQTNDSFAISVWIKSLNDGTDHLRIMGFERGANQEVRLLVRPNGSGGTVNFHVRDDSNNEVTLDSVNSINDNLWHHIVAVRDNDLTLYVDGIKETNVLDTTVDAINATASRWMPIGANNHETFGITNFFKGSIDDVRIYNRALSSNEVVQLYTLDDVDSDVDGMPDWWETQYFGDLTQTGSGDPDGDAWTNQQEYQNGGNPIVADSPFPVVNNDGGATGITANAAWLNGNLVSTGGAPTTVFVLWGTNDGGAVWDAWGKTNNLGINPVGPVSSSQTGLTGQTTYFYRFYATNSAGWNWAPSTTNFTTPIAFTLPGMNNTAPSNVLPTSATIGGNLTTNGGDTNVFIRMYWDLADGGTNEAAWSNIAYFANMSGPGAFNTNLIGLIEGTTYWYRCWASNGAGRVWAMPSSSSFSTPVYAGVDNDGGATNITATAALLRGTLIKGTFPIGVWCYWGQTDGGTNPPAWAYSNLLISPPLGPVSVNATNLQANTFYCYRYFASNMYGEAWASASSNFTTPMSIPAVNNNGGATGVTSSAAWLNGNLTSTGGVATYVWVYWGTNDGAMIKGLWASNNSFGVQPTGPLTVNVAGLNPGTMYYYRYYASNVVGEAWTTPSSNFITLAQAPAINNASGASNVTATTATLNGNLTSTGGAPTTVYCFWGATDGGPVWGTWGFTNNLGVRPVGFVSNYVTSLSPDTVYYYRYYATNIAGSAWAATATNFATPEPTQSPTGALIITEIMADPAGADVPFEWLEVYNMSTGSVDLGVHKFREAGVNHALESLVMPPKGFAIIAQDKTNFLTRYPALSNITVDSSYSLSNTGELLEVLSGTVYPADLVDSVNNSKTGFPSIVQGFSAHLNLPSAPTSTTNNDLGSTWVNSWVGDGWSADFGGDVANPGVGAWQASLTVSTPYGATVPPSGANWFDKGTPNIVCAVTNSPVPDGSTTQFVCTGWSGTGSAPPSGTTTNTGPFTITTNSMIAWNWGTNYWLNTTAGPNGGVDQPDKWVALGSNIVITAAPTNDYQFAFWSGDTNGCSISSNQITVLMDQTRSVTANFEPIPSFSITAPVGTPSWPMGSFQNITWESTNCGSFVALYVSLDGGATWSAITNSTDNTEGGNVFSWEVLTPWPSENAKIRVDNLSFPSNSATSTKLNISAVNLLVPNGGETWMMTTTQQITWVAGGAGPQVDIDFSTNAGGTWVSAQTGAVSVVWPLTNSFSWVIPAYPSSGARVRVTSVSQPSLWSMSAGNFDILPTKHTLNVFSPYGTPAPLGITTNDWGTLIDASVDGSPVADGAATQYVCVGWTGTGDVFPGSGTNTSFNITVNSTLDWQWTTQFMLAASAGANGDVTASNGWYDAGQPATGIQATASNGYHFAGWTGDIPAINTNDNPLTLTMDQARSVTANFEINVYDIWANAPVNGSIAPAGTTWVPHGSNLIYTVTPDPNYHITDVYVDSTQIGATNSYDFVNVTNGGHTIDASFAIDEYSLTVVSTHGSPSPAGLTSNAWNTPVNASVEAVVPDGAWTQYVNMGWIGTGSVPASGTSNAVSFNITNDSALTWQWVTQAWLDVSVGPNGDVDVASDWQWLNTNVVITATPTNGYHFAGWTGDVPPANTNDNPLTLAMDQKRYVTANFAINEYTITATAGLNGTMAPSGAVVVAWGNNQPFTITADPNYHVLDVVVDTVSQGPTNDYTFYNVTNNHTIDATFAIDEFTLTVTTPYGTALPSGVTTSAWNTPIDASVDGSPVADGAATQYVCVGWTGTGDVFPGSGTNTSFNLTVDSTLDWQWTTQFMLAASAGANGDVTASNGWYDAGQPAFNIAATPSNGYHFAGWTGDVPAINTNDNPLTLTMDQARSVMANFEINVYDIWANAPVNGSIAPAGTTWVPHGSNLIYTVTPDPNYHITDVYVDSTQIGATNSYDFVNVTNGGHTIDASFGIDQFNLTVVSAHGSPSPLGVTTNNWNDPINAMVEPSLQVAFTQYVCQGWIGTGSAPAFGTNNSASFNITNDSTITWLWQTNYWLDLTPFGQGVLDVATGWFESGSNVVVTATPTNGWHFTGWSGDIVSTNNPLVVPMNQAYILTATFDIDTFTLDVVSEHGSPFPTGLTTNNWDTFLNPFVDASVQVGLTNYVCVGWVGTGSTPPSGTNNIAAFNIISNSTLTWLWQTNYWLDLTPSGQGVLDVATGWFESGSNVVITATPTNGWHFTGWSGDIVSTNNPLVVPMSQEYILTATFDIDTFTLDVVSEHGSPFPAGLTTNNWDTFLNPMVDASVQDGLTQYVCVGWVGTGSTPPSGTNNIAAFNIISNSTLTWLWQTNYWLDLTPSGQGVLDVATGWFESGSNVVVTATPTNGWHFTGWSGDIVSTNNPLVVPMNQAYILTATFDIDTFTLDVVSEHGSPFPAGLTTNNWDTFLNPMVDASVQDGLTQYVCVGWVGTGSAPPSGTNNITSFNIISNSTLTWLWQTNYWLDLTPSGQGVLDVASGWFESGSNVVVTATPTNGWHFTGWTGDIVSTNNPLVVPMSQEYILTATFDIDTFTLDVVSEHGSPFPAGLTTNNWDTFLNPMVDASVQDGLTQYVCVGWVGTGSTPPSGTNNITSFNIVSNSTLTWLWQTNYWLDLTPSGQGVLDVATGWFESGSNVVVTATPTNGWHFTGWTGDIVSTNNPLVVPMSQEYILTATFDIDTFTLDVVSEHGSPFPAGLTTNNWDTFLNPMVDASVQDGLTQYVCVGWVGTGSAPPSGTNNITSFNIISNSTLTWLWTTNYYLDPLAGANGSVDAAPGWVGVGSNFTITATPDVGYAFTNWTGDIASTNNPLNVAMSQPYSVMANFTLASYPVTAMPTTNGTINPTGTVWVTYGLDQLYTFAADTNYHLADVVIDGLSIGPSAGYTFFAVTNAHTIAAAFAPDTYDITASAGPNGGIAPTGVVMVAYGSNATFTITPSANYHVTNVVVDGVGQGATNSYTFVNVTNGGHTITALFGIDQFLLSVTSLYDTPIPFGLTTNNWNALINASVNSPVPNGAGTQYVCKGWTGTGSAPLSGLTTNTSFNITNNTTLAWNWRTQFMWNVGVLGAGSVSLSSGWYDAGTNLSITATPSNGYYFVNWTGDLISTNNPLNLTMSQAYSVTANFAVNTYDITASAGAGGAIFPTGVVLVAYGSNAVFGITPNANYHVSNVVVDSLSIGPTNVYTFNNVTNGAHTIAAVFAADTYTLNVTSPYGTPAPAGSTTNDWNTFISASIIDSPVILGGSTQYVCTGWSGTGSAPFTGLTTNTSFNITNDTTVTWLWKTNYWLDSVAGSNGSVSVASGWFALGTNVVITAAPSNGYYFGNWSGTTSGCVIASNQITVPMTVARSITANFAANTYTLTATAGPNGNISPSGAVFVAYGGNQAFTITANANYYVLDVVVDGSSIGPSNSYTFANVTTNHGIAASFAVNTYTLSVNSPFGAPAPSGLTTNNWNALINASVNSPVPNGAGTQYVCKGWTGTGSVPGSGTSNAVSFNITANSTLAWNWATQHMLTASAGANGGVAATNGWYWAGSNVTISASGNPGYHFGGWVGDVPAGSTNNNPLTLTMSQAKSVTANFALDLGSVVVTLSPAQAVSAGAQWRLTSGPDTSWHNSGYVAGNLSVTGNPYSVTFSPVAGWTTPVDITGIVVTNGVVTALDGVYLMGSMVLIPGGTFMMGIMNGDGGHQVSLSDFYIDTRPVSVGEFQAFCTASGRTMPAAPPWGWTDATLPMVNVTWNEASAYAAWAGKRLPTEAEYEYVMRSGAADQLYPWGNGINSGNANYNNNVGQPTVAATYPANSYGVFDIAGNVWEWCGDWYQSTLLGPVTDPQGPGSGTYKCLRGGSYGSSSMRLMCGVRFSIKADVNYVDVGFRCANSAGVAGGGAAVGGDSNKNNTPDWWEQWYFGLTGYDGLKDSDGDGLKNWQEYITGTDPTNWKSLFEIDQSQMQGGGFVIKWSSAAGKLYTIERCGNLANGFAVLKTNLPALPPMNVYTDTVKSGSYFYRVKVK